MKQNKIVKIAVTGGIGSGKSTVCNIIKGFGYEVFSCDEVYSELLNGGRLTNDIAEEFGDSVLNGDGTLNRQALSEIVFADKEKLKKLNAITHGKIFEEMFKCAEQTEGLVFFEVPILFEGGHQYLFDEVIVVKRDLSSRVSSLIKRDNLTEISVRERINNQYNYDSDEFTQYYVTHNCGGFDDLCDIIREILLKITQKYGF